MDLIKLGKITAPSGIRGEVRVLHFTDEAERFSLLQSLILDGKRCRIASVRYHKGRVLLRLEGVEDRNAAEALRSKELFLPREELWELPEDTYLVKDLIGLSVEDEEGQLLGRLVSVLPNPHQDLYEVEKEDGSTFLLPAVAAYILAVDLEAGRMTIRPIEGLME